MAISIQGVKLAFRGATGLVGPVLRVVGSYPSCVKTPILLVALTTCHGSKSSVEVTNEPTYVAQLSKLSKFWTMSLC